MKIETFIKYTRWTGIFKKTKEIESSYDIMEWYKLRWYHPVCWILCVAVIICQIYYTFKSIIKEMFIETIEIHHEKKNK